MPLTLEFSQQFNLFLELSSKQYLSCTRILSSPWVGTLERFGKERDDLSPNAMPWCLLAFACGVPAV